MSNKFKIQTGCVVSVHTPFNWLQPKSWLSACIRWFTKSYWQHTGCIIVLEDNIFVIEADPTIRPIKWDNFCKNKIVQISAPNLTFNEKQLKHVLLSKSGGEYDYAGTLVHQAIYQLSGVWLGHTEGFADRKLYCSEYIAWAYNQIIPGIYQNYYKITPKNLAEDIRFITIYKGLANNLKDIGNSTFELKRL